MRQNRTTPGKLPAAPPAAPAETRLRPAPVAERQSGVLVWLLAPITLIVAAAALKLSEAVTLPLAFAYFLALLVQPLQAGLSRRLARSLRWLAVPLTMLTVVLAVAFAIGPLSISLEPAIGRGPTYVRRLEEWFGGALGWVRGHGIQVPPDG